MILIYMFSNNSDVPGWLSIVNPYEKHGKDYNRWARRIKNIFISLIILSFFSTISGFAGFILW